MTKKIFALVMVISVVGAFVAGCSKGEDASGGGATATTAGTTSTAGTTGTAGTTTAATAGTAGETTGK